MNTLKKANLIVGAALLEHLKNIDDVERMREINAAYEEVSNKINSSGTHGNSIDIVNELIDERIDKWNRIRSRLENEGNEVQANQCTSVINELVELKERLRYKL